MGIGEWGLGIGDWRREHGAHRGKKEIHGEIEEKNSLLSVFLPGDWGLEIGDEGMKG